MSDCDKEPCKSALSTYNLLLLDGMDKESKVAKICRLRQELILVIHLTLFLFAAVIAMVALCMIFGFGIPGFCDGLVTLAMVLLGLIIGLFLLIVLLTLALNTRRADCDAVNRQLRQAWAVIERDCPRDCWPAELTQFKCDC